MQEQIALCCKTLKLNQAIAQTCFEIEGSNNQEYLLNVLRLEIEGREERRRNRLLKGAGFYSMKTFEGYSFEGIRIPDSINVDDIKEGRFIEKKENLILYGNVGAGKTHMAIATGINACGKGYRVGFYRTAALVNLLNEKKKGGMLGSLMKKLMDLDLLICDEWGFVPVDRDGAQLLFQVVSEYYERKSLIITTNLEFSKWVNVFYSEQMTNAMIDRIIHYSHLLLFERDSYRTENSLMRKS
ncbi:MAG: IS21-like element helper ATPase IstB [Clostridia bacterium]|nr:IS21-like element helper ATPase IstB [Clostridia bacterium]